MSKKLRAVIDPNVLVAAAIKPTGTCRQLLDAAVEQRWLPSPAPHTPDPDDDYLVALALAAGVDVLISGDTDLTDLPDCGIPVQTPRDFLTQISAPSSAQ